MQRKSSLNANSRVGRILALAAVTATLVALSVVPASTAKDTLTLRVNDAIAPPGGLAAVVIRTYSSRGLGQGQVCIQAKSPRSTPTGAGGAAAGPFASLERYKVFSKRKDGLSVASLEVDASGQTIVLQFSSDSASINRTDGPLAVLYFRVRDSVQPGERYRISVDLANTLLFDGNGNVVPVEPRAGDLRVRSIGDPYKAEAEGDKVQPGEIAEIGLETYEPVRMARGSIGLRYDPAIAAANPKVKLHRRYGKRRYSVDRSTPGLLVVEFVSPNNSWNYVPGQILSVNLRTRSDIAVGTRARVELDPSLTFFVDRDGDVLPYRLKNNEIQFERKKGGGDDDNGGGGDDNGGGGNDDGGDDD